MVHDKTQIMTSSLLSDELISFLTLLMMRVLVREENVTFNRSIRKKYFCCNCTRYGYITVASEK